MANIKTWLLEIEQKTGETIEAIVVGPHDRRDYYADPKVLPDENVVLSREAGLAKLDLDYNNSYGGADCYPMYAWTPSFVYFISEYDGATGLACVPRHPAAGEPQFSGEGV